MINTLHIVGVCKKMFDTLFFLIVIIQEIVRSRVSLKETMLQTCPSSHSVVFLHNVGSSKSAQSKHNGPLSGCLVTEITRQKRVVKNEFHKKL